MKRIIILSMFAMLIAISAFAQGNEQKLKKDKNNYQIMVTYRNYGDSVVVRWAPNDPALWLLCNKYGYKLERVYYDVTDKDEEGYDIYKERVEPVRSEIFKPLSQEKMIERYKDEKHPQGMIATQFLYGEVNLTEGADMDGAISQILAQDEAQRMRFAYTLMAADLDPDVADAIGLRYSFKIKGTKDSTFVIRITPLVDTTIMQVDPVAISIDRDNINTLQHTPRGLFIEPGDKHIKLHWARGDRFTAYYIERSLDGKNFVPLNKAPYFTSSATEEDLRGKMPPDSTNSDTTVMQAAIPMPVDTYHVFIDSVENGKNYYYRVYGYDAFGDRSDYSDVISGSGEEEKPLDPPCDVKAEILSHGKIKVSWVEPKDKKKLQGYLVAHSLSLGDENPERIHDEILKPGTTHIIHENNKEGTYNVYYVYSIDDRGKFIRSNVAVAYISDTIAPLPPRGVKVEFDSSGLCMISWEPNVEPDVVGYKVYYRMNKNHIYSQITNFPTEEPFFLDKVNIDFLDREIYYAVIAVDKAGNHSDYSESATGIIPDIHPPITPLVKSFFAGADYMNIKFIIGSDIDMKEHRVLKRKKNGEWQTIKTIQQRDVKNQSIDFSDKDLKEEGYFEYAMQSEDLSGLRSEISQIIPITIKPAIPEILPIKIEGKYNAKENKISLKWKKPDIKQKFNYVLYKKVGENRWEIFDSYSSGDTEGSDSRIESGKKYGYKILPYAQGVPIGTGEEIIINVP